MTTYRIGSTLVNPNQPDLSFILTEAYKEFKVKGKLRPMCMCNGEPGLPMVIVNVNDNYFLKRMPNTGRQHAVGCGSWETPDEFSGRTDLVGSGISYEGENVMLRLAFPLAKQGSRTAPEANRNSSEDKLSVNNGGKRLSLQALLHMLWEEAGLTKWEGGEPNRTWEYVYQSLNLAVEGKIVKQHPLAKFLFIPQTFTKEKVEELESTRKKRFIEHAIQEGKKGHQMMLLIAELKKIDESSTGGYRAIIKHIPGFSFIVNDKLNDRIIKNYAKERSAIDATVEKWSHQMIAATFSVMPEGSAEIEEISYMPVTSQWIPFDNIYENDLISKLVTTKRSFTRPLRYNRAKGISMPSIVLTDTASGPTALFAVHPDQDVEKVERESLELDFVKWFWDVRKTLAILPDLPPKLEATEDEIDYLKKVGVIANLAADVVPTPTPILHPLLTKESVPVVLDSHIVAQSIPMAAVLPARTDATAPTADLDERYLVTAGALLEMNVDGKEPPAIAVDPTLLGDPLNAMQGQPLLL